MNTESNVGQPPTGTPGVQPLRRRQTTQSQRSDTSFHKRLKDATSVAVAILEDTTWPPRSQAAAQQLLQSINNSPYAQVVSDDNKDIPEDIREAVEQFTRVLKEVSTKLEKVASKYGVRKRGVRERVKYFLSMLRGGRCTQVLETCEDDVSKASTSVRNSIDQADQASAVSNSGAERGVAVAEGETDRPASSAKKTREAAADHADHPAKPPTPGPAPTSQPSPEAKQPAAIPADKPKGTGRRKALDTASKVFSTVETVSGMIPLVGQYIGAGAKVGLTCVEMAQVMYDNEDLAEELTSRTEKLSNLLQPFAQRSYEPEKEVVTKLVQELRGQLQLVRDEIERLRTDGNFTKFVSSGGRSESLKEWDEKIRTTMNDIQFVTSLETADRVHDILQEGLINRLGDGDYGARGNKRDDVVCLPDTRVKVLGQINKWVKENNPKRVFWLHGMAGRGKSAIASTVAYDWRGRNNSCALFHFRRGQAALSKRLICALARQLIFYGTPEVKEAVLQAVRVNQGVETMRMDDQFRLLIVDPLRKLGGRCPTVLLVIDALDECDELDYIVTFIEAIDRYSPSLGVNVKFLITSRPEDALVRILQKRHWLEENLDNSPDTIEDIAKFLRNGLSGKLDSGSEAFENVVNRLAELSQGLFQWAQTALKYIIDEGIPTRRLNSLINSAATLAGLDGLYHQVLSQAFDRPDMEDSEVQLLRRVLGIIVAAPYPVSLETIAYLCADDKALADDKPDTIAKVLREEILRNLRSMLSIPTSTLDPIQFIHTSIRDLLIDAKRCGQKSYFIELHHHNHNLAVRCMRLMQDRLKENICALSDLSKSNLDPEVQNLIRQHVPWGLRYCCRAWSKHLASGLRASQLDAESMQSVVLNLQKFSEEKLIFWLEVMSLIGAGTEAIAISKQVVHLLQELGKGTSWEAGELPIEIWSDSHRFISAFLEPIEFGALHIYMSALPSCPTETLLYKHYEDKKLSHMKHGPQKSAWSAMLWSRSTSSSTTCIAFSPDGKTLASGSGDQTIRLWDVAAGAPVGESLKGHAGSVQSVAFSPDGKTLASGSHDQTIRLWNVAAGAPVGKPLEGHISPVWSVAFSPDSKTLASGSDDGSIRLWDVAVDTPAQELLKGHTGSVQSVPFSPDGKPLASGSYDGSIRLRDTAAGKPVGEPLKGHTTPVQSVAFSLDGKTLASGSDDGSICLWDVAADTPVRKPLKGHTGLFQSLPFSPDGKPLASGSYDGTIRLWDVVEGAPVRDPWNGRKTSVLSVAFSPDGKPLASGSDGWTIRLWDGAEVTSVRQPLQARISWLQSVAFSPDGKTLAYGSDDNTIRLWDVTAHAPVRGPLEGHTSCVQSVAFSPDGKILASGSDDNTIRLWDVAANTPVREPLEGVATGAPVQETLKGHTSPVTSVGFSLDGKTLASGSDDGSICLWDVAADTPVRKPLKEHTRSVQSVAFSPDGKTLASGSYDQTIRLWDVAAGKPVGEPLKGHTDWVQCVAFSLDGKTVASGSHDQTVRLWDVAPGAPIREPLKGHTAWVWSVAFSPAGKTLASGSWDGTIRLWDVATGKPDGEPLKGHTSWVQSVAFSPHGKTLASGSSDETIRLWNVAAGAPVGEPLKGHTRPVNSVAYISEDLLVSRSFNETFYWSLTTGSKLIKLPNSTSPAAGSYPYCMTSTGHWVTFNGLRLLWLPADCWTGERHIFIVNSVLIVASFGVTFSDVSQAMALQPWSTHLSQKIPSS